MSGRLENIWIKPGVKVQMSPRESGVLVEQRGLEGNADQGGTRQVTMLERSRWERAQKQLGAPVDPTARRANLMVSGVELMNTTGRVLRVGSTKLRIRGETRPCTLLNDAHAGLKEALDADWGGGAYAEVVEGGEIRRGDEVAWDETQ